MDAVTQGTQVKPKRLAKDLATQIVPECTPGAAVTEYFHSKFKENLSKKKPEWDWPPLSPATQLVAAYRDLEEADRKLEQKWDEGKEKRKQLDKWWQELREKEEKLRQSFIHFNKFVKENREKRERAEKKIQEEKAVQERQQKEIMELRMEVEALTHMKETLEQHVNKHKIYEDYLKSVVADSKEYSTVFDILNRYEALHAARMELTERQEKDLATLQSVHSNMVKSVEEKSQVMLGLNSKLADLQTRYDRSRTEGLHWETSLSNIKDTLIEKSLEIDQVKTSGWNLYQQICLRQNMPLKLEERETEQQLIHIKHTIRELEKVVCTARQHASKEAASNVANPSSMNEARK